MPSNQLIIGNEALAIDWPTVNFRESDPGYTAYCMGLTKHSPRDPGKQLPGYAPAQPNLQRYRTRTAAMKQRPSLALAQKLIRQFVVHLDGCDKAETCFNVLHNERGLSCHFIIDNDGTIYQTLDLLDCAFHASGMNETSIGVELCNRGDASKDPAYYERYHLPRRDRVVCTINHEKYVSFDFMPQQYDAMIALGKALARYLPGIKLTYPQWPNGEQRWETLDPEDTANVNLRESYSGYLGHYHINNQKWDPGPFDFRRFITAISGHRKFPIGQRDVPNPPGPKASAAERASYDAVFQAMYENNEQGPGGFFPVGPLEDAGLWHGGVHLHDKEGAEVAAPLPGRVVVARNGRVDGLLGSNNFVLVSHTLTVGGEVLAFFSLYDHLREEKKGPGRPKWMASNEEWARAEAGRTALLDAGEPVQAGEVIGHVGVAGPEAEPQIHWEIFSADPTVVMRLDKARGFWKQVSGSSDQRYCTNPDVLDKIDRHPKDGKISPEELADAYHFDPDFREWTRRLIASHYSEWSDYPPWQTALHGVSDEEMKALYAGLWLTPEVAQKLGLVWTAPVYTYHPVSFLKWVNAFATAPETSAVRAAAKGEKGTGTKMVDIDDKLGKSSFGPDDNPTNHEPPMGLPEMVKGYSD